MAGSGVLVCWFANFIAALQGGIMPPDPRKTEEPIRAFALVCYRPLCIHDVGTSKVALRERAKMLDEEWRAVNPMTGRPVGPWNKPSCGPHRVVELREVAESA